MPAPARGAAVPALVEDVRDAVEQAKERAGAADESGPGACCPASEADRLLGNT